MLLHLLLLLPCPAPYGDLSSPSGDVVTLADGPAARAWAAVDPGAIPTDAWLEELGPGAPELLALDHPWTEPATWDAWGRWLGPGQRNPSETAALAILAARHGRPADAWSHFAALTADPATAAATMPRLLPGIPSGPLPQGPLPDGCLLHPMPPPGSLAAARRHTAPVFASTEFRVGAATVRLVISVESTGVEVKLHHLAGGPATFQIQLPDLPAREIRIAYIDWLRQDTPNPPLLVELTPNMESPVQLFGRYTVRKESLPALPDEHLPIQLHLGGLWLEPADNAPPTTLQIAVAKAISATLCIRAQARSAGTADPHSLSGGITVRLPKGPAGERRLALLASATEAWTASR
jgi:hypothetical protein